ncbi:6451_t:CDS:2, partial [Funneliformis caledonium]
PRPGDGGVELFRNYEKMQKLKRNIGPRILLDLEVLSKYHESTTIEILVVPFNNKIYL